jgi:hypothetical protein
MNIELGLRTLVLLAFVALATLALVHPGLAHRFAAASDPALNAMLPSAGTDPA